MTSHQMELLVTNDERNGRVEQIISSHDNRSCVLVAVKGLESPLFMDPGNITRYVFNSVVVAEEHFERCSSMICALSYDGTKFAVAERQFQDERYVYAIKINSEQQHIIPCDTVRHLTWLDNDRLACMAFNKDDNRPSRRRRNKRPSGGCFVNGKMVRGLNLEPFWGENMRLVTLVLQNGEQYTLFSDGSRTESEPYDPDTRRVRSHKDKTEHERPEEVWDDARTTAHVIYKDASGPAFHAIESFGGMRQFAFNEKRTRVAYIGMRYPYLARQTQKLAGVMINRAAAREVGGKGFSPLDWPVALLFNPYFGPARIAIEASRRFFPVNHGKAWTKGYKAIIDYFITPKDQLVVTASDGREQRVVIDEVEGPAFDQIVNIRYLKAEGGVCYMARRGNRIYRVTVN